MQLIDDIYRWVDWVLVWSLVALRVWAVIDCATRKAAAFPAANKLTKPAWLAITIIGGGLGSLLSYPFYPLNIVSLISVVAALVYLCDVRPAVREVSGGNRGW
jgi:Protein of unknown function (DUF2516)